MIKNKGLTLYFYGTGRLVKTMNPHFFFQGKLSREESASAYLATLLEQFPPLRAAALDIAGIAEPAGSCTIQTEQREVDIRLDYPDANMVVLVENKVRAGALQVDQLSRYYEQELSANPDLKIIVIMVAPGCGSGEEELKRLHANPAFRPTDQAVRLSWDDLASVITTSLPSNHPEHEFASTGMAAIQHIIQKAKAMKYPLEGLRDTIHEICVSVKDQLESEFDPVNLGIWRMENFFDIYSVKSDMSISIAPYYDPEVIPDTDEAGNPILHVKLLARFKLSAQGSKKPERKAQWRELIKSPTYDCNGDTYQLTGKWFQRGLTIEGSPKSVENTILKASQYLVGNIVQYI